MIHSDLRAILLVLSFEQLRLRPYDDGVGVQTIGWGHRILPGEDDLRQEISRERANSLFLSDFERHERMVINGLHDPMGLSPLQLGACVSLCFNIGGSAFANSSVAGRINDGATGSVPEAFRMWNKGRVGGVLRVMSGLSKRRESEVALWIQGSSGSAGVPESSALSQRASRDA